MKTYFNAIDFIMNECNDVKKAGYIHDNLRNFVTLHGTTVRPTEDEVKMEPLLENVFKYFTPNQPTDRGVTPAFCSKMKELSEKESEKDLFLKFKDLNVVVYPYGMGVFDKDYDLVGFVGDTAYEKIDPIYENYVIKSNADWSNYRETLLHMLSNDTFIDTYYTVWDMEYTEHALGALN